MKARIKLMGGLHVYEPLRRRVIEVEGDSATVKEILTSLGFPTEYAWIVVAGDGIVGLDYRPADGEEVCVYPPANGG